MVRAREQDVPVKVLGRGANVLVSDDGFDGVVVRLDHPTFRRVTRRGSRLEVGAGVDLIPLARRCSARGLSGLECMAGIPATVGGAVRMNAGGRFGEFSEVVRRVEVMRPDGERESWTPDRCGFGYRRSSIDDHIVLAAELELREDDPIRVRQKFEEYFELKRATQPLGDQSAGCIFKNPSGRSAGALIDQAGLKGTTCGEARVSERHANFIVAQRGAKASDVLRLIDVIRERVLSLFSTELEVEIDIWKPVGAGVSVP
jgi:UDP-N-acetylmuramate dehydrogenase